VRTPARILIADDVPMNRDILQTRLRAHGYETITAADGEEALEAARAQQPDLILLDIMMPKLDGIAVCRALKAESALAFTPIIMVTAKADSGDVVAGLEAGGDEYLTKPVDPAALVARVRSMLRIKALHDTVREQSAQLAAQADQLADWNRALEARVQEQLGELERVGRLKRFLSPQLVELVVSSGDESFLHSHRREIAVVFCDLRGYTPFVESTEPEEMMAILREYHEAMGALVFTYEGTVGRFAGDGLMIFFNDPLPCPEPAARAVRMALAMRQRMAELGAAWRRHGYELGFGLGVTLGYATLGRLGFEGRFEYEPNGTVVNLAARLCAEAVDGQILVSQRVYAAVEHLVAAERLSDLTLKGLSRPVSVFNVVGSRGGVEAVS
jgi:class 3 adenylate cyclase/CheY-like chemotaxis protein